MAKRKSINPAELPAPDMAEFATRDRANEGHTIPLHTPDGRLTKHWLRVRGVDSDEFIRARNRQNRKTAAIVGIEDEEEREEAILDATLELHCALVADWSFADPALMADKAKKCTPANVKAFLRTAPQIAAEIDRLASHRTFFFKMPSGSLMPSQPPSSD
jgi:hypothetical protein